MAQKTIDFEQDILGPIGSLKKDVEELSDKKITKFYASNQGETYLADSDNGKIMDMMLYGKSSQDGTPTPTNPIEIKSVVNPTVKVVGKNLLNAKLKTVVRNGITCTVNGDGTLTLNGTAIDRADFYFLGMYDNFFRIILNPKKEYICKGTQDAKIEMYIGRANKTISSTDGKDIQIKNESGIAFVMVRINSGSIINNSTVYMQIEEGSVSTAFKPYHEQAVTLPYTLNAIPVSSGGNITIDGQPYIADRVVEKDGVFGIERNTVTDVPVLTKTLRETPDKKGRFLQESAFKNFFSSRYEPLVNIGYGKPWAISENMTDKWIFGVNKNNLYITPPNDLNYSSEDVLNALKDLNIKVYGALSTSIFESLQEDIQSKLRALSTNYPVTNISITSDQLDGYAVFNYPVSMANGWNYVKQQLNDNRDYIYDMDLQSAEAYVNSEYAVALTELEV